MLDRKHIRAPRSFDPGKGHPRERLIYANDAEMEMLRVLTDGTISRGPRGIPSFAVTSGKTTGTTISGNPTSSNPSGGGPGGPFGPNSGPSKATSSQPSGPASGVGGGNKGAPQNSAPKSPSGPSGPNSGSSTGKPAGGSSASGASTPSAPSRSPSSPSVGPATSPSSPMGGQGSSFGSSAAAASYNRGVSARNQTTPTSPMGGQQSSFSRPSAAADANRRTASAIKGGQNPSGSTRTPSALSGSQIDAYKTFGRNMAAAPRQPEITRTPGDAEQLARMARAENDLIRDPVTGKMSPLAAQGTMNVIRNRAENQGVDVEGIISQSGQFSPWGNGTYAATKPTAAETAMAEQVLRGVTPDYTATPARPQGADYYHNTDTVKNKSGYSNAATKSRVKDRFASTMSVADAVKPGVYGHDYGYDPTGMPASSFKTTPMAPAPKGRTDYGTGRVPTAANLPQGALSADPNFGRMASSPPNDVSSVGGRFAGSRPNFDGPLEKISYDQPGPVNIPGGLRATNSDYYSRWNDNSELEPGMNPNGSYNIDGRGVSRANDGTMSFDVQNPNMVNEAGVPYGSYDRNARGKAFDPNDATAAQRAMNQAIVDAAYRTQQPVGMFSGDDGRGLNHIGNATDINLRDPVTGNYVEGQRLATGATVGPDGARQYRGFANDVFDNIYGNPDLYGEAAPNARWGGNFTQGVPRDYMHFDTTLGGGINTAQAGFRRDAMARAGQGEQGGYMTASATSPMSPDVMNSYTPPEQGYQLSEGGIYNGLRSIPGAISGLGQGIRSISQGISTPNPAFKGMAGMLTSSNPIVRAGAQAVAGQVIGPQVKEFARSTIQGIKDIADPNNPRAQEAERERKASAGGPRTNTAGSVRSSQSAEQRDGPKRASATKSGSKGNPDRGKGGDRENDEKETVAQKAARIGKKKIEDLAKPEPKAVDWSSYTNVMTKEQAMRKLLGEEWYA